MSAPQADFAQRCLAALRSVLPDLDEAKEFQVLTILSGAWLAFDTARSQQERNLVGTPNRSNRMPPLVEEVEQYLVQIEYPIDAQHFIDFYQTRGWKISKGVPMKDWKSALRNWKRENWGHRPGEAKAAQAPRAQMASLGSLQVQLASVRQEISNIVRPGGAAHARLASSISPEEMKRYNELVAQRDALVKRIGEFYQ